MICYRSQLIAKQWVMWTITKIFLCLPPNDISDVVIALNEDLSAIARWFVQTPQSSTLIRLSSWLSEFRRLRETYHFYLFIYLIQYLSWGIQFSRASLNGALTKHKNKDIKTLKLDN